MAHGDLLGVTRARVRESYCPKCGAAPGEACHGLGDDKRPRVANHAERRSAAKIAKRRRAAARGRGADIWERVVNGLGYEAAGEVEEHRRRPDIVRLESEIERAFAVFTILMFQQAGNVLSFGLQQKYPPGFLLVPQFSIGQYRVDFVLGLSKRLALRDCMVIELDGHEWHEKTKEQVARDKARDRYLSRTFGRVIHFSGSEVYNDIGACYVEMAQVFAAVHGLEAP